MGMDAGRWSSVVFQFMIDLEISGVTDRHRVTGGPLGPAGRSHRSLGSRTNQTGVEEEAIFTMVPAVVRMEDSFTGGR